MSTLFLTLIIAFVLVMLAIASMAMGWLFSGKSKIIRGACGMDPQKLKDQKCGTDIKCGICEDGKETKNSKESEKK